jgi:multiple sugar transport system permease protein
MNSQSRLLWALYLVLAVYAVFALFPFVWMLISSFKQQADLFRLPPEFKPSQLFTDKPFKNYTDVWTRRDFFIYFRNSVLISSMAAIGQVMTCALAGYAFAKMPLPGKNLLFAIVLATAFVPTEVTIIPEYLLMRQLGWIDTWLPLIVPSFLVGAFGTFMLREYFGSLPDAYAEAAKLDGANPFQIFWYVYLPLARPALISIFVIAFIANWDELLRPLLFLNSQDLFTVPLGLMTFFNQYEAAWHQLMAASVISILPLALVYIIAQRYVLEGFMGGGTK